MTPTPVVSEAPYPLPASGVVDLLTGLVTSMTGLNPTLVRPRWQPTPPAQPPVGTSWAAVGVVRRTGSDYPYQILTTLPGTTTEALFQRRWEELEVVASFYGPAAEDLAEQFRDGSYVTLNLEALNAAGLALTEVGEITAVPDLLNLQWLDHQDVRLRLQREVQRYYPLQSLLSAVGALLTDHDDTVFLAAGGDPLGEGALVSATGEGSYMKLVYTPNGEDITIALPNGSTVTFNPSGITSVSSSTPVTIAAPTVNLNATTTVVVTAPDLEVDGNLTVTGNIS